MDESFQKSIVDEGLKIFSALKNDREGFFDKDYWFGRLMEWAMKDPSFKVDLFRFVDVLPMLSNDNQIAKHIKEYLLKKDRDIPIMMSTALKAASFSLAKGLAANAIRKNVADMAQRFIAGRTIDNAKPILNNLKEGGFNFTVDLLGEKTLSDVEADSYLRRYLELIEALSLLHKNAHADPPNISIKVSALSCNLREEDPQASVDDLNKRILPLLRAAKSKGVFINFDVESFQTHEIIYHLFETISLSAEFRTWPHLGIVLQAYLQDALLHVQQLISLASTRKTPITVRIVKGAYWDYEVVKAEALGHRVPVFLNKAETDVNYEALSKTLLDHCHLVRPAFASHNIRSLAHAIAYAKAKNIPSTAYEIQMLYGMANAEMRALQKQGHHVRIYVPIGEMLPGMSYLVRRLLENTSQMGFIKLTHHDRKNEASLLTPPRANGDVRVKKEHGFINAPHADFARKEIRASIAQAIAHTSSLFPLSVAITIDGTDFASENKFAKHSPNDLTHKLGLIDLATVKEAELAVNACAKAFAPLRSLSLDERADHLMKLALLIDNDRAMLAALICHEVGKTWAEADADVAEAIDFCRYYAERARIELAPKKMGVVDGEHNLLTFQGRGPTVVIAPWNFPLAILCGMSVAAYVAGNPIILKPAEQASLTARMLFDRMIKAGLLKSAVQFLPGKGEEIGSYLVNHHQIANICFTGSMKVGHEIIKAANTVVPKQIQMKRVICEMGGKNTIIVDEDADLDEAVQGVIISAFAYAGQKCSAASRVVVIGTIKEQFIERLVQATSSLRLGRSTDASTFLGPVVDQEAHSRLLRAQENLANDKDIVVLQRGLPRDNGYFVPTMLVLTKDPQHWVMQEELFGPILAIYHAPDLQEAINVANHTKYALTGALFSRSPENIAYAREQFLVGNLYLNQKCTGAIVARQPFGGYKMSGTGIKAGGPHYLLNLVDSKLVSENTMRRGFTPEVSV